MTKFCRAALRILTILTLFLFISPRLRLARIRPAFAADFTTTFLSKFEIDDHAMTRVSHVVKLVNGKADLFASEYSLTLGSTHVRAIRAFDGGGNLSVSRAGTDATTMLSINLESRPAIGEGASKQFTIEYMNDDIATAVGRVLEVNIPRITNALDFTSYQVTLVVPSSYGKPSNIIPTPTSIHLEGNSYVISFENVGKTGISAVFGSSQTYAVNLKYFLDNGDGSNTNQDITLIPDTPYQRVHVNELTPKPQSIKLDPDGNWIARYEVGKGNSLSINLIAFVQVFMDPEVPVTTEKPERYLAPTAYWESAAPEIRDLAKKLQSPKQIYDFVVSTLRYNYKRIEPGNERLGATGALSSPDQSICTEFTDLFIAIARAAGIPARELNGFAYTENEKLRPLSLTKDILHAWPEFWDSDRSQWVPVDPTWGNTTGGIDYFSKLDFNHVTFVVHGSSPLSPLPAGFFKPANSLERTVFVTPSTESLIDINSPGLAFSLVTAKTIRSFFPAAMSIEVTNLGSQALYGLPVRLSMPFQILSPPASEIPTLLPLQTISTQFVIKSRDLLWRNKSQSITATIGDKSERFDVTIAPPFSPIQALAIVGALVAVLILIRAIRSGRLSLHGQRK